MIYHAEFSGRRHMIVHAESTKLGSDKTKKLKHFPQSPVSHVNVKADLL